MQFLLVSLLTLLTFVLLFTFRSADDNRLTSWQYVFNEGSPVTAFVVLLVCMSGALFFPKLSFSVRFPSLLLFISSFAAAAFFWEVPEVIVDASRYFTQAKHLELYGFGYFFREWGRAIHCWTDLPLVPFLYGVIFRFCGESRVYVQVFTSALFSMTVVLTYLIGRELWDEETGLLGGALLLGMPYLFSQVPLMLVDIPTMFFLTLAIFTFMKGAGGGNWMMVWATASLCLALLSKYSAWPMLSVLAVIVALHVAPVPWEEGKKYFRRSVLIAVAALAVSGLLVLSKYEVFLGQLRVLMTFQGPGLRKWGESFLSTFFFQVHPFITVAALFSIIAALRKKDLRYAVVAWLVVIMIVFQVKRIRYSLPLFPMVALMASYGLQQVRDREVRRFIVLCVLASSLTVAVVCYRPFLERISTVNLKSAGEFLNRLEGETAEVYALPQEGAGVNPAVVVPLLDLYTKKNIIYRYDAALLPHEEGTEMSPLRFTWEYANPRYYGKDREEEGESVPVVIVSGGPVETLPREIQTRLNGYRVLREFNAYEGIFTFRTTVTVYSRFGVAKPPRMKAKLSVFES